MKLAHSLVGTALAALALPSLAQVRVVELSYEAIPTMITMPVSAGGELVFQACATCKVLRLRANAQTRYYIGKQEVALLELRRYMDDHPVAPVLFVQPIKEPTLSRVNISATARAK